MRVVVIGGGAAGFFAALSAKAHHPAAQVMLLEKTHKPLAKVRISGGGRCNTTHHCMDIRKLAAHYPRGERFLRKAFKQFAVADTIAWFAARGVRLKTEEDGRMFPTTDDSETIAACLMQEAQRHGIELRLGCAVQRIKHGERQFHVVTDSAGTIAATHVIITTGGHPKPEGFAWIQGLGHSIVPPVPSLFTFNMPGDAIRGLMGVVADPVHVRIPGTGLEATGPLLITHWGMSGPAILRLSAWGARAVHGMGYHFEVRVNWAGGRNEQEVRTALDAHVAGEGRKQLANARPFALPRRLWEHLLAQAELPVEKPWAELGRRQRDRLVDLLTNDRHEVRGKTTFKEEFVTAGGVALEEVDPATMASRKVPGLHFAGEVLDIDGITGGFNFQAAWTTGFIAGMLKPAALTDQ